MIENFNEVQEYLTANGESDEVKSYLQGFKSLDLDGVKSFLESNEDGKGYLQSFTDGKVTKGIETFKQNNLQKLVEAEMLKKNPKLTPEQLRIQELESKFADMEKAKSRAEMSNKFKDVLGDKKIPSSLTNFLLADDEDVTNANITLFEDSMKSYIDAMVEDRIKQGSYTPPKGDITNLGLISQAEYDKKKNDLNWYEKNRENIMKSFKEGLIK